MRANEATRPSALLEGVREILVAAARAELSPRFAEVARAIKADGSIVTAADTAMQARMQAALAQQWPQFGFLGEEMQAEEQRAQLAATSAGLWCIDPLDGTTNFANGVPFFSVSLALLVAGQPHYGWIYDPLRDECFMAERGRGVWLNGQALTAKAQSRPLRQCIGVVDFKRLKPALAARLGQDPPYGSQRNFGSCALEWCWLAAGRFQLYLHGGQKLWDYAAGIVILAEAGGHACTLEGEGVFADTLGARSVVAARDPELFTAWQAWIAYQPGHP